jgi:hypothetical protein
MMTSGSWWQRLREAWHGSSLDGIQDEGLPKVGEDGLLVGPSDPDSEAAPDKFSGTGPLSRWSKRDQTLVKLQEGYEQVTRVIQEIQNHLVIQADRSERICTSLEQLARSAIELPAIGREQSQTLETIAAHIEASASRTQQLADSLTDVPKLAKSQSEALVGINRQMEMAGEQRMVATQTLERIGGAIGTLSTASQGQTDRLKMIEARTDQQVDLLTQVITRQNRRFIMLFVVTVILAVAALGAASFLVWSGRHG